ncbi:MAG: SCP2 sterol-binding domain-containing protein [Pseudomonadota bacterium]
MLDTLTQKIRDIVAEKDPMGFNVLFDLGDTGAIHIAAEQAPVVVSNERGEAVTTFVVEPDDLNSMLEGDLQPMGAFMSGKLKVEGDMGKAMQIGSLF